MCVWKAAALLMTEARKCTPHFHRDGTAQRCLLEYVPLQTHAYFRKIQSVFTMHVCRFRVLSHLGLSRGSRGFNEIQLDELSIREYNGVCDADVLRL